MNAVQIAQLTSMSKARIAREWGVDRRTVDNLIADIPPGDKSGANPKWFIKDVAGAMDRYLNGGGVATIDVGGEEFDPKELMPADRKNWYESEVKRLAVEKEQGRLIQDDEFETALAEAFKIVKTTLVTLADVLERDVGLSAGQVIKTESVVDVLLTTLYSRMVGDE